MKKIFLLVALTLIQFAVFAAEPFIWRQSPDSAPIILPRKDHQTHEEALDDYFRKVNETPSLSELLNRDEIEPLKVQEKMDYKTGTFESLKPSQTSKPRFVVVTNELRELYAPPYGVRARRVINRLEAVGAEVLILPVVHDITLNAKESKEFREKLIKLFDAQLVLGGNDIDPYLYGEKTTYAKTTIRRRDVSELKFVRQFIESKKGMNFGICRGHQMCAVANHKKLVQDIQIEEGASEIHLNGDHLIKTDRDSEFFSIFDKDKILVNSLHHQAVIVPENDKDYKVIATSLDKNPIVEAIEFKNGMGVTLQFHPELMFNETGDKILKKFVDMTIKNKRARANPDSCSKIMSSFHNL